MNDDRLGIGPNRTTGNLDLLASGEDETRPVAETNSRGTKEILVKRRQLHGAGAAMDHRQRRAANVASTLKRSGSIESMAREARSGSLGMSTGIDIGHAREDLRIREMTMRTASRDTHGVGGNDLQVDRIMEGAQIAAVGLRSDGANQRITGNRPGAIGARLDVKPVEDIAGRGTAESLWRNHHLNGRDRRIAGRRPRRRSRRRNRRNNLALRAASPGEEVRGDGRNRRGLDDNGRRRPVGGRSPGDAVRLEVRSRGRSETLGELCAGSRRVDGRRATGAPSAVHVAVTAAGRVGPRLGVPRRNVGASGPDPIDIGVDERLKLRIPLQSATERVSAPIADGDAITRAVSHGTANGAEGRKVTTLQLHVQPPEGAGNRPDAASEQIRNRVGTEGGGRKGGIKPRANRGGRAPRVGGNALEKTPGGERTRLQRALEAMAKDEPRRRHTGREARRRELVDAPRAAGDETAARTAMRTSRGAPRCRGPEAPPRPPRPPEGPPNAPTHSPTTGHAAANRPTGTTETGRPSAASRSAAQPTP